jgi:hypothetical protein
MQSMKATKVSSICILVLRLIVEATKLKFLQRAGNGSLPVSDLTSSFVNYQPENDDIIMSLLELMWTDVEAVKHGRHHPFSRRKMQTKVTVRWNFGFSKLLM